MFDIKFSSSIVGNDKKFSAVNAFDDYFNLSKDKYKVVKNLGGKGYFVDKVQVKNNIPLNILKVISYLTGIIPLIMLIGKSIARVKFDFYGLRDMNATVINNHKPSPSIDKCLNAAFDEGKSAEAAWLINQGANLDKLELYAAKSTLTHEKKELLQWLKDLSTSLEPTPENLDHFALKLGYGYKSANLLVMEKKADEMSQKLKTAHVKVPPFMPLADMEISQYLRKEVPEIFTLWNDFTNSFDANIKNAFLEAKSNEQAATSGLKITEEGDKILKEIQQKILNYFENEPYSSLQMQAWLKKENPQFLIIRSTGKEDSDTNSNAGGNASIPYVKPNEKEISSAIGKVIASYFGEKSINQRILCGDRTIITDKRPFMPVLMQEMIGENVGGKDSANEDIPRSGVLFTRQSDKAKGVTFIQTGLGNNEGVVSSQVGVDSYYVKEGKIHAVIRKKETRFVSVEGKDGSITVEAVKNNNKALEMSQALPPGVILDIKRIADHISADYSKEKGCAKPMDMEYTVKLKDKSSDKPVIYLLQARPLLSTQGEEKIEHTYLDLKTLKEQPKENTFTGEVLLDGNAYVRQITDWQAIIFAEDLPKGEYAYSHAQDPSSKKVIVIKKTAPATSHEAVILRPKGVAVIVVSDPMEFEKLKKSAKNASPEKPLLVDTQRGMVVSCSKKEDAGKLIREGLVSYPIPLEVTVPPSKFFNIDTKELAHNKGLQHLVKGMLSIFDNEADDLIKKLQAGKELLPVDKNGNDVRELLDIMATKNAEEAKLALATLLRLMKNRLVKSMKETDDILKEINTPLFQVFEAAVNLAKKEILPAFDNYAPETLERLYPIKFLDAMLFQKGNPNIMGNHSYSQVFAFDKTMKKALKVANVNGMTLEGTNGKYLIFLMQLANQSYSEACRENWLQLVKDLSELNPEKMNHYLSKLLPIITEVTNLNIGDKWLNKTFNSIWKNQSGDKEQRLEAVVKELQNVQEKNQNSFMSLKENSGKLKLYGQNIALWSDPNHAKTNAKKLIKSFTEEFGFDKTGKSQNSITQMYAASDELGRLAVLQYARDAVNVYDSIIKAVKGSSGFPTEQTKALQVAELLEGYFEMLEATFTLISKEEQEELQKIENWESQAVLFDEYLEKLKKGVEYEFGFKHIEKGDNKYVSSGLDTIISKLKSGELDAAKQLEARPQFAVDSLIIGSHADLNFSVHWPDTLEEYFTAFHQNMEQVVKYLNTKNGLDSSLLSKQVQDICSQSEAKLEQGISYVNFNEGKIEVGYQIPVRQHSSSLIIGYDPQHPEKGVDIKVQMFGNDEVRRWDWAAAYGSVLAYAVGDGFVDDVAPKINYAKPEGVSFTVKLSKDFNQVEKLVDIINFTTRSLIIDKNGKPWTLLHYIEKGYGGGYGCPGCKGFGKMEWSTLNPECYKYTIHMNRTLIKRLAREGDEKTAALIAINSIRGLAYYGIKDYYRDNSENSKENNLGEGLKIFSLQFLQEIAAEEPEIQEELKKLLEEPDVLESLNNEQVTQLKLLIEN